LPFKYHQINEKVVDGIKYKQSIIFLLDLLKYIEGLSLYNNRSKTKVCVFCKKSVLNIVLSNKIEISTTLIIIGIIQLYSDEDLIYCMLSMLAQTYNRKDYIYHIF